LFRSGHDLNFIYVFIIFVSCQYLHFNSIIRGSPGAEHAPVGQRLRRVAFGPSGFSVGGVDFYDLPVAVMESKTAGESRIEDGLLPTSLFQSVYFNHWKKFVTLNPSRESGSRK
jgi:hypothetical protein